MAEVIGLLGGSALEHATFLRGGKTVRVRTPHGRPSAPVRIGQRGNARVAFLLRHGEGHRVPPHRINHRANLLALKKVGARRVVSTSSVGSLKRAIRPGSLVVPDDYFAPWDIPTYYDERAVHVTPHLDERLRKALTAGARKAGMRVRDGGVYVQTRGPRLETKAEINVLRRFGDVVGMTMASEATLAAELGLRYASLCSVDNYCHGITNEPLRYQQIVRVQRRNAAAVVRTLAAALEALA